MCIREAWIFVLTWERAWCWYELQREGLALNSEAPPFPCAHITQAPLVSSLALMYDLARPNTAAKEGFAAWVAGLAPDDLDMVCLSPGRGPA